MIPILPGSSLRMHVESLGKPRDSTSVLEALPDKLDIKNTHLVFSMYTCANLYVMLGTGTNKALCDERVSMSYKSAM